MGEKHSIPKSQSEFFVSFISISGKKRRCLFTVKTMKSAELCDACESGRCEEQKSNGWWASYSAAGRTQFVLVRGAHRNLIDTINYQEIGSENAMNESLARHRRYCGRRCHRRQKYNPSEVLWMEASCKHDLWHHLLIRTTIKLRCDAMNIG